MVNRNVLVEDWQQVEQTLCDMELCEETGFESFVSPYGKLLRIILNVLWHILEYLIRRDKA